jgi:hypothetical protein
MHSRAGVHKHRDHSVQVLQESARQAASSINDKKETGKQGEEGCKDTRQTDVEQRKRLEEFLAREPNTKGPRLKQQMKGCELIILTK